MSTHEHSPDFDPTVSADDDETLAAESDAASSSDELSTHTPTPAASSQPSHEAPRLIEALIHHAGTQFAVAMSAIGLTAVIEGPSCLLKLSELGNGLLGAVCAGGIIVGLVALDRVADSVNAGVESAWRKVWRSCKDRAGRGEGIEKRREEEEMVFDEEGIMTFLQEAHLPKAREKGAEGQRCRSSTTRLCMRIMLQVCSGLHQCHHVSLRPAGSTSLATCFIGTSRS
jgi:hypothetical protein